MDLVRHFGYIFSQVPLGTIPAIVGILLIIYCTLLIVRYGKGVLRAIILCYVFGFALLLYGAIVVALAATGCC